jgi:eukaryotic-like serine/threonine-protein kinase
MSDFDGGAREPPQTPPELREDETRAKDASQAPTTDGSLADAPGDPRESLLSGALILPARYRDLGRIAAGSFGEIRRVHDDELDRVVAMKLLRADVTRAPRIEARFVAEAKLTAELQHPGIVGVHDRGRLADGRLWFTMREVRGRTLGDVIDEVHAMGGPDASRETPSGWTFRRLADAFARVCQAVAYAHRRGIVHRDLKPDNIMVGELGEALVMDWGLGRRIGARDAPDEGSDASDDGTASPQLTRHGDVLGTPAYMPPEQALGQRELHGLPSDVYALGAVLYHLLAGRPPYAGGSASVVLRQVMAGPPVPVVEAAGGKPVPAELAAICARAMQREMAARYPDAEAIARDVLAWLDGADRREQALAVVARARVMEPEIAALRAQAGGKRAEAQVRLDGVRSFDPVEKKEPGWALEDEAGRLEVAAALREAEWLEALQGALTVDPDLPEAHDALADHHREALIAAERAHHEAEAARAEALLRAHDRGRHAALLRGEGALTLVTDPPGAEVTLERYVLRGRRLAAEDCGVLGISPLREVPLQKGSYRLRLRAPGRHEVKYPVLVERGGHWDGRAPGERDPHPIHLPPDGELGPDDCYVPASWCWIGGDTMTADSLPRRRIWVPAFVIRRFPVTTAEYLAFMNDLAATGRVDEALAACPRAQLGLAPGAAEAALDRDATGRFILPEDRQGLKWRPDWPVVLVDWHAASAYADWLAAQTSLAAELAWRLPNELEREKAARGVDGRLLPWGDHVEPTFACVLDATAGEPAREAVGGHPSDESVYGARGLAGNTRDWCGNRWTHEGPRVDDGRLRLDRASSDDPDFRAIKGGAWASAMTHSRAAARFGALADVCRPVVGIRLARSYDGGAREPPQTPQRC